MGSGHSGGEPSHGAAVLPTCVRAQAVGCAVRVGPRHPPVCVTMGAIPLMNCAKALDAIKQQGAHVLSQGRTHIQVNALHWSHQDTKTYLSSRGFHPKEVCVPTRTSDQICRKTIKERTLGIRTCVGPALVAVLLGRPASSQYGNEQVRHSLGPQV